MAFMFVARFVAQKEKLQSSLIRGATWRNFMFLLSLRYLEGCQCQTRPSILFFGLFFGQKSWQRLLKQFL